MPHRVRLSNSRRWSDQTLLTTRSKNSDLTPVFSPAMLASVATGVMSDELHGRHSLQSGRDSLHGPRGAPRARSNEGVSET